MFWASVPSKLAASLVCKCKICFMFVHRVFNYARGQSERDAVGQQQIWDAPDPAVLPALLPGTLWGPGEHTELKVSFRLWIYIEWPDLFYQTGCRDWQKNGESHQSWVTGAEESRGAATPGPGVSGSEAKGTFDVTQSVLTRMFVSAVSTGNPGRLTRGRGADARVVLELSPLPSDAVTRSGKGFMFSIGDKNIATETPLRERDQKNALLETGRIEQMNRQIKPDGQKSKAVPPPARSLAPAHAAPWRLLFALLVWGWGGWYCVNFLPLLSRHSNTCKTHR